MVDMAEYRQRMNIIINNIYIGVGNGHKQEQWNDQKTNFQLTLYLQDRVKIWAETRQKNTDKYTPV